MIEELHWMIYISSDKGMTNIKGVYVATAPIYKTLKNYTDKTNIYIDHVNTVGESYKKWGVKCK